MRKNSFKMCSVGDDVFENGLNKIMIQKEKIISNICNKCRSTNALVVLRHKDAYCKNCFLTGTTHKFKALLGKSRLIHPNDKVLIHHKIGHPSTALLHFLRAGLDLNTPKKFRFESVVLFIEDQFQLTVEERQEVIRKIKEEVTLFGFKVHFISFTKYVLSHKSECGISDDDLEISKNDKEKLKDILDKKVSKTNKSVIIDLLKRQLLIDAAKKLNCDLIFTPEISVDTASNLLSNISLGRGCHVAIDTGLCDDRDNIKILRPLRLFDMKELAFYNRLNNLEPIFIKQYEVNHFSSVQDLMMKFVKDLQENYPATVTTVLRTGDKLASIKSKNHMCKLCKGILVERRLELTSEDSIQFSHLVSTSHPDYTASRQERYQNVLGKFDDIVNNDDYCYACSKISSYIKL